MGHEVDRRRVLAYRARAQELDRRVDEAAALAVLDLGVQDTPPGSAPLAITARSSGSLDLRAGDGPLAVVWSVRGAPHVHRRGDLPSLAAALWPWSDADAKARLGASGVRLGDLGIGCREALTAVVEALRDVVTKPLTKAETSKAVTEVAPDELSAWCRPCQSVHVDEQLLRLAALPAGLEVMPGVSPVTFAPIEGWPVLSATTPATDTVVAAYLRLLGPARPGDVAGHLTTTPAEVRDRWPDDLTEVRVEGRPAWLFAADLDTLLGAEPPTGVRLLPPADPFLQARDRDLVVPDARHRKELWRVLARRGAVLADGDVVASWQQRKAGRRLDITVTPFDGLPTAVRRGIEEEAAGIGAVRGTGDVALHLAGR